VRRMSDSSAQRTSVREPTAGPRTEERPAAQPLGRRGLVLVGVGVVLLVLAFALAPWFARFPGSGRFADVHHFLTSQPRVSGLGLQYFTWLAPALALALAVLAAAANLPRTARTSLAGSGAALAGAAVAVTFLAIHLRSAALPVYWTYLSHARAGFYLAVVGFLALGAGALAAPRR
jgi:hypothetical protein